MNDAGWKHSRDTDSWSGGAEVVGLRNPYGTPSGLTAALEAASKGYYVLPVRGKRPLVKRRDKSTWTAKPFVVDLSNGPTRVTASTPARQGWSWLTSTTRTARTGWDALTGPLALPEGLTVHTASGGQHRYYRGDGVRNSAGTIAEGVAVRGEGGFVVGPGSTVGGKKYQTEGGKVPPAVSELREAPEALLSLVRSRKAEGKPEKWEHSTGTEVPDETSLPRSVQQVYTWLWPANSRRSPALPREPGTTSSTGQHSTAANWSEANSRNRWCATP